MMRIGQGWDIHRLVEGRRLWLAGVEVPFDRGLMGHSDGDAALHALCDALLGAIGAGDIGTHFPDSDPQYRNIDSAQLLQRVAELLAHRHYTVNNVDVTILAERPKLAPLIAAMRARLAELLSVGVDQISIKAKTMEGLESVGRGDAIASQAVVLVSKRTS